MTGRGIIREDWDLPEFTTCYPCPRYREEEVTYEYPPYKEMITMCFSPGSGGEWRITYPQTQSYCQGKGPNSIAG